MATQAEEEDASGDQAAKRARTEEGAPAEASGPAGPLASGASGETAAASVAEGLPAAEAEASGQAPRCGACLHARMQYLLFVTIKTSDTPQKA